MNIKKMFRFQHIKIVLLLSFCFALRLSAQNKQLIAEMLISYSDTVFKYNYLYNNRAQLVVETKTLKNGNNWDNISQTEWLPQTNLPTGQIERIWANNKWNDSYKISYQNIDSKIVETHSTFPNAIETAIRMIEYYFTNNLKTKQTEYFRQNNGWVKALETHLFYSSVNLVDSTIANQFNNNELQVSYKTHYSYYPNGSLKSIIVQVKNATDLMYINSSKSVYNYKANAIESLRNYRWNRKNSNWESDTKLEYLYDLSGNKVDEILWQWNSMFWQQVLRYNYQYNSENKLHKKLVSTPIYREWRNTNSVNYNYETNSHDMTIESVYEFWGGKAGDKLHTNIPFDFNDETIVRNAETIQLYIPFIATSLTDTSVSSHIKVYPNPSHGVFYISNFETTSSSSWTLRGLNGTVYLNSELNLNSSVINISELPNGIYLLTVRSGAGVGTHKIVKY